MVKYLLVIVSTLFIISCKTPNKLMSSSKSNSSAIIFSLTSTSCMGECPEYELLLKEDSTIHFEGKKFTTIVGKSSKKLSAKEYIKINEMINEVDWSKLEKKYVSKMMDLPSYTFTYNIKGVSKNVFQYGSNPKSLIKLRKSLILLIDNKDFF